MTGSEGQAPGQPYSADELAELTNILGDSEPPKDLLKRLQRAALIYQFLTESDQMRATRRQRHIAFAQIASAARKLQRKLDDLRRMVIDDKTALPLTDIHQLVELAEVADEAAKRVPRSGADPGYGRKRFVADLGEIYLETTQRRPTMQRSLDGQAGGTFFEFVQAALKPLDRYDWQTVETDVRAVVAAMKKLEL